MALVAPWLNGCGDSQASASASDGAPREHRDDRHKADKDARADGGDKHRDKDGSSPAPPAAAASKPPPGGVAYYLSMHGAKGGGTVMGLDADGKLVGNILGGADVATAAPFTKDMRGLAHLADGSLLVASSWQNDTRILRFGEAAASGVRPYLGVFTAQGPQNPAMVHVYSIAVAPDGSVYASNQDTNTVTRYAGIASATPGAPLPSPPALADLKDVPPGVFVASSKMATTGLVMVRGIAFGPDGLLYVADRDGANVSAYDTASGARVKVVVDGSSGLKHPIQFCFSADGSLLYTGDNVVNAVFRTELASGATTTFIKPGKDGVELPSSLLIVGDDLIVGDRRHNAIWRFKLSDGARHKHALAENLPDAPEFVIPAWP